MALDTQDWPENYQRAPVATMWTLFYGGDTFCPELSGVQQELQDRYIGAVAALAERVADLDNVLGYDTLNEPANGYIGRSAVDDHELADLRSARAGAVESAGVPGRGGWRAGAPRGRRGPQPRGRVHLADGCPWQRAGVWDVDGDGRPVLVDPVRFAEREGVRINAFTDFHVPFIRRFRERLRAVHPDCLLFIEGSPWDREMPWDDPDPLVVNARHWYDIVALGSAHGGARRVPRHDGPRRADEGVPGGARHHEAEQRRAIGRVPRCCLGEFGVPYEMNGGGGLSHRRLRPTRASPARHVRRTRRSSR